MGLCRISNDRVVKDYPYNNNVLPKAREGVRRGPKNPQDPHYLDQPKGPIPRGSARSSLSVRRERISASRALFGCQPRPSRSPPERPPVVKVQRLGTPSR